MSLPHQCGREGLYQPWLVTHNADTKSEAWLGEELRVEFEPVFRTYAEAAVGRLGYIFSDCSFSASADAIEVAGNIVGREATLSREVLYHLYRERIYQDTLSMRAMMYKALLT